MQINSTSLHVFVFIAEFFFRFGDTEKYLLVQPKIYTFGDVQIFKRPHIKVCCESKFVPSKKRTRLNYYYLPKHLRPSDLFLYTYYSLMFVLYKILCLYNTFY